MEERDGVATPPTLSIPTLRGQEKVSEECTSKFYFVGTRPIFVNFSD